MKTIIGIRAFVVPVLALVLAQLACGSTAPSSSPANPAEIAPTAVVQPIQPPPSTSSEHGTADEAQAMLKAAIDHYNSAGRDQALADFNAKAAPFFDRDLYVVCMGSDHIETANGGFPQYVGFSADTVMDSNGNPLGKTVWDTASAAAVNTVDYKWLNPVSNQTEPKKLYFQKVGTEVCGVGVYSP
jgi:hypothetical protein